MPLCEKVNNGSYFLPKYLWILDFYSSRAGSFAEVQVSKPPNVLPFAGLPDDLINKHKAKEIHSKTVDLEHNLYDNTPWNWGLESWSRLCECTSALSAEAPSPGFAWPWLNGLCISQSSLEKKQCEAGPSVLESAHGAFCQLPLPPSLWYGLSCNYSREPIAGGRPVN